MKEIKDFCVSSNANGFDEFLKVLKEYFKLHLSGRTQKYYGVEDGIFSMWSSIPNVIEVAPQEAIALLTGKQLTEGDLIVGNRFECIKNVYSAGDILLFKKGSVYKCNDRQELIGEIIRVFYGDRIKYLNKEFKLLPTQESVKGDNAKEFLKNKKITRATCYTDNGTTFYLNDITVLMDEYSTQQTAHLQQQLKEAKELLDTTDDLLTRLEDYTHGKDGESITELRALINKFLTRNK